MTFVIFVCGRGPPFLLLPEQMGDVPRYSYVSYSDVSWSICQSGTQTRIIDGNVQTKPCSDFEDEPDWGDDGDINQQSQIDG